jgi:formyltetrahydrofolate deformylase
MNTYVLLIACPDQKGLIHNVTGILYDHNLNIISNGEFVEKETDRFFMRTEFAGDISVNGLTSTLREVLPATAFVSLIEQKKKDVIVMATRESHCLGDLLIRHYSQSLPVVIRAVVSNYDHLRELTEKFHIDYHHVSHENCSREEHEARIGAIIDQYSPDYLVLAKYMRILSPSLIRKFENRIVNIHHSFLPAFVGARPYEKAYARGVKIIGATAHFVNEDLDEGPIIAQNVIPVSHSHSARDMAQAGKDVEKIVLAKALKLVAEDRVFVSGNKTIIFD